MADGQMLCWGLRIIGPSNRRVLAASSPRQGATTVVEQGACAPVHGFAHHSFVRHEPGTGACWAANGGPGQTGCCPAQCQ